MSQGNGAPPEEFVAQRGEDPAIEAAARAFFEQGVANPGDVPDPGEPPRPPSSDPAVSPQAQDPPAEAAPPPEPTETPEAEPEPAAPEPESQPSGEVLGVEDGETLIDMGNGQTATLTELVQGALFQKDYTRKSMEIADERRAIEVERAQMAQAQQQGMQQLGGLIQQLQYEVNAAQPSTQQLAQLRQRDPAEYSAVLADMQRKQQALQVAQYQYEQHRQQAEQQERAKERTILAQVAPDDFGPGKYEETYRKLTEYALSPQGGGLSADLWEPVFHHRYILSMLKAMRYDEATRKGAPRVARKLSGRPKVVRPGVALRTSTPGETSNRDYQATLDRLKKENEGGGRESIDSLAQAFLARSKVSKPTR